MTVTLKRLPIGSFFRLRNDEGKCIMAICGEFVGDILNKNVYELDILTIKVSTAPHNPKKKGWVKIEWKSPIAVSVSGNSHERRYEFIKFYSPLLEQMGLYMNTFWMRIEEVKS